MTSGNDVRVLEPTRTTVSGKTRANETTLHGALFLLTMSTGAVDAVSYLGMGHVFTANMTGNVVFLGFALAGVSGVSVARSVSSLVAFFLGAIFGGQLARRMAEDEARWSGVAFLIEGALLLGATIFSAWHGEFRLDESAALYVLIALTAVAMGVRNSIVRKLAVPDLTTTVLTLTVTGLAADSSLAGGTNPRWATRVVAIVSLFLGAGIGALLLRQSLATPLFVCSAAAFVSALVMFRTQQLDGGLK